MTRAVLFGFILVFIWACNDNSNILPKPRIYPRVIYPEKNYKQQVFDDCPFEMMVPEYFVSIKDTFIEDGQKNKCWFDLHAQNFDAYLHLSYIVIDNRKHFDKLMSDAFELADKHNIKASFRDELKINKPEKDLHGILFEIEGPVATPLQFFVTDSTNHFMRGSLYFKSQVNRDSIAPIYEFLREDIVELLNTYSWK